jgi:multidrug efflux pump subunit AcrA (membrane-fusion protein)
MAFFQFLPCLAPMPVHMSTLRALHDRLIAERPDGATHDEESCPFCAGDQGGTDSMGDRTFTEAELQAAVELAVAEATAPLQARLAELQSDQHQSALERAVAEVKAETQAAIAELQAKLDAAVLDAAQAKEAKDATEAAWAAEKQAAQDATELAARKEGRLAAVREVACFPETYLTENGDRFAALPDEEFQARLDEWRAIAGKEPGVPANTSLKAARDEADVNGSLLGELGNFRRSLVDPRTV